MTNDPERRPVFPGNRHPFEAGLLMPTPMIERVLDQIINCINGGIPGAIVIAHQRYGKTRMIRLVRKALSAKLRRPCVARTFVAKTWARAQEDAFFQQVLMDVGHKFAFLGRSPDKRSRLSEYLATLARSADTSEIILLVDNAECLLPLHFLWLADVFNELEFNKLRMFTLLVGEPDLATQRESFLQSGDVAVVGRFMVEQYELRGIANQEDLQQCLRTFDWMEAPKKSGWPCTRYFLPRAFEAGFRLSSQARQLFQIWKAMHKEQELPGRFEAGMQYFHTAVMSFFRRVSSQDDVVLEPRGEDWEYAIKASGYLSAARYVRRQGKDA